MYLKGLCLRESQESTTVSAMVSRIGQTQYNRDVCVQGCLKGETGFSPDRDAKCNGNMLGIN
jgi:hypothetical protein